MVAAVAIVECGKGWLRVASCGTEWLGVVEEWPVVAQSGWEWWKSGRLWHLAKAYCTSPEG